MHIQPLDPKTADEATLQAYATFTAEHGTSWQPEGLPAPPEYILKELRNPPADKVWHGWLAYDGDDVVGTAELQWRDAPDNRDRAWVHFEIADPASLDELAAVSTEHAVAAGRSLINPETPTGSVDDAWVAARGAVLGSVEEHNVSRFAALDRSDVAALAAAVPAGYELLSFDGPIPDDIVDAYVELIRTMNDAPRDDLTMEDWTFTVEKLRIYEASLAANDHTLWTLVAREQATGRLAGLNQLVLKPEWPEVIENEDTCVARSHRGHGLGLWIKAVNLLRAMDETDAKCISTWNAASNAHMLRVNRRLGFVCEKSWNSYEVDAAKLR